MSQSNPPPAAGPKTGSAATPGVSTVPPPPPPPAFRAKGAQVGSILSKLGPLLVVLLIAAVVALFLLKKQEDQGRLADDRLAQKIESIAQKNTEAPKRIEAYEGLLRESEYTGHPYLTDVRVTLINEYFEIITSFDAAVLTTDQVKSERKARLMALVQEIVSRPGEPDQRSLLAYYKRGQILEDDGDYAKAIADYQSAQKVAGARTVLVHEMESYLSFRIAQCYYWQFRQATDPKNREDLRLQASDALTKAQNSKDVKSSLAQQIDFLKRELAGREPFLDKVPDLAPRTPVVMEPVAAVPAAPANGAAPAVPAEGPAAPAPAPANGAAPAPANGGAANPPAVPAPAPAPAPTEGAAPAPANGGAAAPAPTPAPATAPANGGAAAPAAGAPAPAPAKEKDKPAGGGWLPH